MNPLSLKKQTSQTSSIGYMETKEKLKKEIGARLRRIRKKLGFTQEEMVAFLDIGRANYSRIEKGEVFPNPTIFDVLYFRFNVNLEWLVCNEASMFRRDGAGDGGFNELVECSGEVKELLFHIENVPMLRHAILGFFLEYKEKNKKIIDPVLKKSKRQTA